MRSSAALPALGEILCQIKSKTLPSQTVPHKHLAFIVDKNLIARRRCRLVLKNRKRMSGTNMNCTKPLKRCCSNDKCPRKLRR
ncbi:uncharacterized protein BDW70DRAFT_69213 [Aspergillus foveolatus]|uniref:uncharacterized protein n=1 Tax=Aspergillus foveolatus TaxID=210207 RepID=UPI003CCDC135